MKTISAHSKNFKTFQKIFTSWHSLFKRWKDEKRSGSAGAPVHGAGGGKHRLRQVTLPQPLSEHPQCWHSSGIVTHTYTPVATAVPWIRIQILHFKSFRVQLRVPNLKIGHLKPVLIVNIRMYPDSNFLRMKHRRIDKLYIFVGQKCPDPGCLIIIPYPTGPQCSGYFQILHKREW